MPPKPAWKIHSNYCWFNYSPLGHVITGDLNIVSNPKLRDIFRKGPKYRLPRKIDWSLNYDIICKGVLDCQTNWAKRNHIPQTVLDEWVNAVLSKVKSKATKLSQGFGFPEPQSIFHDKGVKKCLQNLHERFVVTTADKAGNNIVFICKNFLPWTSSSGVGYSPGRP